MSYHMSYSITTISLSSSYRCLVVAPQFYWQKSDVISLNESQIVLSR